MRLCPASVNALTDQAIEDRGTLLYMYYRCYRNYVVVESVYRSWMVDEMEGLEKMQRQDRSDNCTF